MKEKNPFNKKTSQLTTLLTLSPKHATDLLHSIAPLPTERKLGLPHSQIMPSL